VIANQYLTLRLMSLRSISPCVGGSNPPPGTIFQNDINDLIFCDKCYSCVYQKHTKHTLFCVCVGLDYGLKYCVLTLLGERSCGTLNRVLAIRARSTDTPKTYNTGTSSLGIDSLAYHRKVSDINVDICYD
jgi:hypothetical protein